MIEAITAQDRGHGLSRHYHHGGGWLAAGLSHEQILADYPELTENDIRACLAYAADRERRLVTAAK
jgi:hypothetical protein